MNFQNIFTIIKKELRSYFDSPVAYIVLIVFLLLWEFLFFRNVFLVGEDSLSMLFELLPWLFLLLIPAITMGSLSQEKSEGTLELLLTHPLRDLELLLGKFLAAFSFVFLTLLLTLPIAVVFKNYGPLDWGVVMGQYLGALLMAGVLISLGLWVSNLFKSQVAALMISVVMSFILIIAGFELVTASLPIAITPILEQLSVLSHFNSMARGVIDVRDLWYFLSAVFIFGSLTYVQFLHRQYGNQKKVYLNYQIGISLFIGIAILLNVVGAWIPGRIDLTENRQYSLSSSTKEIVTNLNDLVNITLYASSELPSSLQPVVRDVKDTLRDYQMLGKGNIILTIKDPAKDTQTAQEATANGVQQVQFNVIGNEEYQVKTGYLGLVVAFGGKTEAISYIENTSSLEYDLTSFIKELTLKDKKTLGFLSGQGEKSIFSDYGNWNKELQKYYSVKEVTIDDTNPTIGSDVAVLVIAGPSSQMEEKVKVAVQSYLDNGGSVLFLIDTVSLNLQMLIATPNQNSFADFLANYGIQVQTDLVYDLRSNEIVNLGNYLIGYPFWVKATVVESDNPLTSKLDTITLPWASSLKLDDQKLQEKKLKATNLFVTTNMGGTQNTNFNLNPTQQFSQDNLGIQTLVVALTSETNQRLMVVGDSDFLTDQFTSNSSENLALGLESIAFLAQESSLANIKLKENVTRDFTFENETQVNLTKYGNMAFVVVLPLIFGLYRFLRRRNLSKLKYQSN